MSTDSQEAARPAALLTLPIPPSQTLSLEHPCIVHNLDRGIQSLGGPYQLSRLLNKDEPLSDLQLALSVRPEDIFAAPVPSHHVATSNILLRVTVPKRTGRKRKRGSQEPYVQDANDAPTSGRRDARQTFRSIEDNHDSCAVEAIGLVRDTLRYRTITQFQYAASSNPLVQYMKESLLSNDYDKLKTFHLNAGQLLKPGQEIQPSPVLSIVDLPYPYNYRQNASVRIVKDQHGMDYSINDAKPGSLNLCVVDYDIETVPGGPPITLPALETLDVKFLRLIKVIEAGLLDRPVMTTRYQLQLTGEQLTGPLRRVLPYVGYMFKMGPFRDALIRYGFDPRADPSHRQYQMIQVQLANADKKVQRYGIGSPKPADQATTYKFDGTEVYTESKVFQFCDITDPVLRKLLDEAPVQDKCEPFTFGWYGSGTWALLRTLLKDKIDRLIKGDNKEPEFYLNAMKHFPDDIDQLPPSLRPSKDLDPEIAALLAKARSVARSGKKGVRQQSTRKKGKQVRFKVAGSANLDQSDADENSMDDAHDASD